MSPARGAIRFTAAVIEWRGPSPFYFAPVPPEALDTLRAAARGSSYGWGVVPVTAWCGGIEFTTSLIPRDGGFLAPLKDAVRRPLGISAGDEVTIALAVRAARSH